MERDIPPCKMEEWKALLDLIHLQHSRYNDFNRMCLTANAILLGLIGVAFRLGTGNGGESLGPVVDVVAPLVGLAVCIVWILTLFRLNVDSDLRWWQIRDREARMKRAIALGLEGYRYFKQDHLSESMVSEALTAEEGKELPPRNWWFHFPAKYSGIALAGAFSAGYLAILLHSAVFALCSALCSK